MTRRAREESVGKQQIGQTYWDFRNDEEKQICTEYIQRGYSICKGCNNDISWIIDKVSDLVLGYIGGSNIALETVHERLEQGKSNDLRLHVLKQLWINEEFSKRFYVSCKATVDLLAGNEVAMQKRIGLSVQLPNNSEDELPIHADTWNGVSPYELNILMPLVDCKGSMSLYILERDKYKKALRERPGLLHLDSSELLHQLWKELTWVELKRGEYLAFDQSLPHGFTTNQESFSHWSLNCRFKSLYSPYSDKRLGEYFLPVGVKACTMIGLGYKMPNEWISE